MEMSVEVKNYITEQVVEELYANSSTIPANSATPVGVVNGRVPQGYDAVIVGIACTQNSNCSMNIKIDGKYYYPNPLNTAGLGGLTEETYLFVPLEQNQLWELGFTNLSGSDQTIAWRLRIRLFRR